MINDSTSAEECLNSAKANANDQTCYVPFTDKIKD